MQEARAVQLHLDGLKHLNEGNLGSAKDSFGALLKSPFITDSRAKHVGDPEVSAFLVEGAVVTLCWCPVYPGATDYEVSIQIIHEPLNPYLIFNF